MKKELEDEVVVEEDVAETVIVQDRLTADFGRDDLNDLRDAVNELFRR